MSDAEEPPAGGQPVQQDVDPSSITGSRVERDLRFSAERSQYELKAATAERKYQLDRRRLEHELAEERQENAARRHRERVGFYVVICLAVTGLVVGFVVSVAAADEATRRWAQSIVTLLLGGIVGGLAGYFTGKVGK